MYNHILNLPKKNISSQETQTKISQLGDSWVQSMPPVIPVIPYHKNRKLTSSSWTSPNPPNLPIKTKTQLAKLPKDRCA